MPAIVVWKGTPTWPFGKLPGVICRAKVRTERIRAFIVVCGVGEEESLTWTEKSNWPPCEGVPESMPLAALSERPDGNVPEAMPHWYGGAPPVAVRLAWNWMPTWAFDNGLVAICNGAPGPALTVRVAALLVALPAELLTTTVNWAPLSEVVSLRVV